MTTLERAKAMLTKGMKLRDTASRLGLDPGALSRYAKAWGLVLKRGRPRKHK